MTIKFYNQKPNGSPNDNGTFNFDKNLTLTLYILAQVFRKINV